MIQIQSYDIDSLSHCDHDDCVDGFCCDCDHFHSVGSDCPERSVSCGDHRCCH